MNGYVSPIKIICDKIIENRQEEERLEILARVNSIVDINEEELVRALSYDEEQYNRGYDNGFEDGYEKAKSDFMQMVSDLNKREDKK